MKQNKLGFTLIELLVVVIIIAVLAAIALPQYEKVIKKSRALEAIIHLKTIVDAQERYAMANGEYTNDISSLDILIPTSQYYTYQCREQRTCDALPKSNDYPRFQFHMQQPLATNAYAHFLGKHWCQHSTEKARNICKTLGKPDTEMSTPTSYYLMN